MVNRNKILVGAILIVVSGLFYPIYSTFLSKPEIKITTSIGREPLSLPVDDQGSVEFEIAGISSHASFKGAKVFVFTNRKKTDSASWWTFENKGRSAIDSLNGKWTTIGLVGDKSVPIDSTEEISVVAIYAVESEMLELFKKNEKEHQFIYDPQAFPYRSEIIKINVVRQSP